MDYYPVRVRLPAGVSPDALLREICLNMDKFVESSTPMLSPFRDEFSTSGNVNIWRGKNPTGSFVTIAINPDPGSVAVIDSANDHWTFGTVQSPQEPVGDARYPVSGNRQFGYVENQDGTVTFYTRGVDRIADRPTSMVNWAWDKFDGDGSGIAFNNTDALWRGFQQGIEEHVNRIGGRAQIEDPVVVRPRWTDVRDVLTGRESVQSYVGRSQR